ncbi:MAG: FIST C-terminal domain-containing protein [Polyangiaceae bacterium]|nr:FIST C-terminal domain-containing protein [Polyangiaceae bacterium]
MSRLCSARSAERGSEGAARELCAGLAGADPRVVVFFAAVAHDGALLGRALEERFPGAVVVGSSTNGEFCDRGHGKGGAVAIAIPGDRVGACAAAMADAGEDVDRGVREAAARLSSRLGRDLRELDPARWAGVALLEGARGREERINEALGDVAPFLPFVGGSAGDDITFSGTWTWADGALAKEGTALLVAEMRVPFRAFKTCHFEATDRAVTVTRSAPARRLILELDGEPAADRYAREIGVAPADLATHHFMKNPLGLMIDGEPWLRSAVRREGDALFCACAVVEGARLHFMRPIDMVEDARAKLARAREALGGEAHGALLWNCAYRMLEAELGGLEAPYHAVLSSMVHAGCHSNGESYLGHINQTLTGLIFG